MHGGFCLGPHVVKTRAARTVAQSETFQKDEITSGAKVVISVILALVHAALREASGKAGIDAEAHHSRQI